MRVELRRGDSRGDTWDLLVDEEVVVTLDYQQCPVPEDSEFTIIYAVPFLTDAKFNMIVINSKTQKAGFFWIGENEYKVQEVVEIGDGKIRDHKGESIIIDLYI